MLKRMFLNLSSRTGFRKEQMHVILLFTFWVCLFCKNGSSLASKPYALALRKIIFLLPFQLSTTRVKKKRLRNSPVEAISTNFILIFSYRTWIKWVFELGQLGRCPCQVGFFQVLSQWSLVPPQFQAGFIIWPRPPSMRPSSVQGHAKLHSFVDQIIGLGLGLGPTQVTPQDRHLGLPNTMILVPKRWLMSRKITLESSFYVSLSFIFLFYFFVFRFVFK